MKKLLYVLAFFTVTIATAQDFSESVSTYLNNNRSELGLQSQDVAEFAVKSNSYSKSMDLENVYVNQTHQGIEIFNSTSSFAIKNGTVVNASLSFTNDVEQKVNTTTPSNSAAAAISSAASAAGIQGPMNLQLLETVGSNSFIFSNGNISLENIPVKLVYQSTETNTLRLAWDLSIALLDGSHYYSIRIDAVTGAHLDTIDWVLTCNFGEASHSHDNYDNGQSVLFGAKPSSSPIAFVGDYRVFPIPAESPNHGSDELIIDPADAVASPFGWHDTDGIAGADFTITRGNNVHAQDDINGNNGTGASPDGGANLLFDFPFDFTQQPVAYLDGSTTNLFYLNNIMHDVWYRYGFDEASGNFQENNYGNGGNGGDSVSADAQDGSGTNNANFGTPPDGGNPRMQMFLWDGATGPISDILTINGGPLAGIYSGIPAGFGGAIPVPALTEDLVLVEDDNSTASTDINDACDPVTNGASLVGKIAVIRRGACEFGFKALAAEDEGAIAVIMVNNVAGDPIVMGGGAVGGSVTIPLFMINNIDGEALITELGSAVVNGTINGTNISLDKDGSLDNGIIGHEYGHGISNRLTAGPSNTGCLNNSEQMGEGWSDYVGMMITIEPGDQGADARGIGTFATGAPITGGGIRPTHYSTDMSINNSTYNRISSVSIPHGVGYVWATMIWDMTWDLIDANGGTIGDVYTGTSGNNIAMQLVLDGMKLQPCNPGFVDGRDAILLADRLSNGGANQCLIWEAFARRGLGVSAVQGSSNNVNDGTEAFDVPTTPGCLLSTSEVDINSNFSIYPNPSNGNINISSIVDAGDVTISIVDLNGRTVFTQNVELYNSVNINAESLNTGVYIVQINGNNYTHTAKLIIK
ncbi:MAG: extracellular elastinolytic metalloproteinase [Ulvibacter sp.]|jgi:extracellular elastinolytic metalloproteinase